LTVERRLSVNSVESYARDLHSAAGVRGGKQRYGRAADATAARGAGSQLMSEGRSPRSVARAIACYRGFYRFLTIDKRIKSNPADQLRAPRSWKSLPRHLSVEEVDKLLQQPDVSTPRGLRDRALIELLYATGLRVSELISLRPPDVNLDASILTCTGKGDKQRVVPIWATRQPRGSAVTCVRRVRRYWEHARVHGCSSTRAAAVPVSRALVSGKS
jgi:integrase/recombinase XerD